MSELRILEQLEDASNGVFLAEFRGNRVIYKPSHLERELWDFPTGSLALRERATYLIDMWLGWNLVPETNLISTEDGIGSIQNWVPGEPKLVDIVLKSDISLNDLPIVFGNSETGHEIALVHSDNFDLQKIVLLDAITNNADRKGGHILTDESGTSYAIDHGVTFHTEPKLRTVLWGWAGSVIPEELLAGVVKLNIDFSKTELPQLLSGDEIAALTARIQNLLETGRFPEPNDAWPSLPWPLF